MVRASSRGGAIHHTRLRRNSHDKHAHPEGGGGARRAGAATGIAAAQSKTKVSIAVGGAGCLCYLPTVLAKQLGEYEKAGVEVEMIDFKGGSQALQAVIGGSADVVSGYYDHCVNLAAKGQIAAVLRGL